MLLLDILVAPCAVGFYIECVSRSYGALSCTVLSDTTALEFRKMWPSRSKMSGVKSTSACMHNQGLMAHLAAKTARGNV